MKPTWTPEDPTLAQALWAGDVDKLHELAPCRCCCHEHTFRTACPAWAWGGCRGQHSLGLEDVEAWAKHYGMTVHEFLGE